MKFHYNQDLNPPAPLVSVRLSHPFRPEASIEVSAKVDTAADVTGIPETSVTSLQLERTGQMTLMGFDRQLKPVHLYSVVVALPSGRRGRLNAVAISIDYVLLGRDVLNHLRLLLDGPALTLEILE